MKQQCIYECGPYKNYCGRAEYDEEAKIFHGDVIGTRDVVTFQGKTLADLPGAFAASVDDYLKFCEQLGQVPEKPFSGKFVARVTPELHQRVSIRAQAAGKSLNQFVIDCLEAMSKGTVKPEEPTDNFPTVGGVKERPVKEANRGVKRRQTTKTKIAPQKKARQQKKEHA